MIREAQQSFYQVQATVTSLQALSAGYCQLIVVAPEIARQAQPGQFAQLRVATPGVIDPLLARPISIAGAAPETGEVTFIFKVVGRGTALLAGFVPGQAMTILGPIGNGFAVPHETSSLALLAGGVGMPPLYFLAATLRRTRPGLRVALYYGGRTRDDLLLLPAWEALGVACYAATDDGSYGHRGLVTEVFLQQLPQERPDFVAACGPKPMLRAVQRMALEEGIPGQLSLEARMACGVGACLGCVCATVTGNRRVCVDGPVFPLDEVRFDV